MQRGQDSSPTCALNYQRDSVFHVAGTASLLYRSGETAGPANAFSGTTQSSFPEQPQKEGPVSRTTLVKPCLPPAQDCLQA